MTTDDGQASSVVAHDAWQQFSEAVSRVVAVGPWPVVEAADSLRHRTGAPWRDVPERYGPWDRAYDLFRRRQKERPGGIAAGPADHGLGFRPRTAQRRPGPRLDWSRAGRPFSPRRTPRRNRSWDHVLEEVQDREWIAAGADREGKGCVFASPIGGPLSPKTDFHVRKRLLRDAGVRDGRLHDARHTAATVLLILGVPDVVIGGITGWEPGGAARMPARKKFRLRRKPGRTTSKGPLFPGGPSTSCPVRHWRRIRDSNS